MESIAIALDLGYCSCMNSEAEMGHPYALNFEGLLSQYHLWRFHWLGRTIARLPISAARIIELGCFDARSLEFVPIPIDCYEGFESHPGAVALARRRWNASEQIHIHNCESAEQMQPDKTFNVALCMEVLEHLSNETLHGYLAAIARSLDGYLLVTVPVEFGPCFLFKNLLQRITRRPNDNYRLCDTFWASLFRPDKLPRQHHKGFDYRALVTTLGQYFEIESVEGMVPLAPAWMGFTVGIVARTMR